MSIQSQLAQLFSDAEIKIAQGDYVAALTCFKQAALLQPALPDIYFNQGVVNQILGDEAEAEVSFLRFVELSPNDPRGYFNLGNAFYAQGKLEGALLCFETAIQLDSKYVEAMNNRASVLQEMGRLGDAVGAYCDAIDLKPDYPDAYINLGNALYESGRLEDARASLERAAALQPDNAKIYNSLGVVYKALARTEDAIFQFKKALSLNPSYAEAHSNLGGALRQAGKLEESIVSYQRSLALMPDNATVYANLGVAYKESGKIEEAIESSGKSLSLNPNNAVAYNNLGIAYQAQGNLHDALECFEHALLLKPEFAEAHWNLAIALLLSGNYERGWVEYEWGFAAKQRIARKTDKPLWDGSPLDGKTILIRSEQGLGDTIQFARFLPAVKTVGGKVILECQEPLINLLKNCGADQVVARPEPDGDPKIPFDVWFPLMSLPGRFKVKLDAVSSKMPFLYPDPSLQSKWQSHFDGETRLKVGIVWAGSATHQDDRNRSCRLSDFAPLMKVKGIAWYSLQKGEVASEIERLASDVGIVSLGNELLDFSDTAAAINNLDLVIAVDTSVVHLAGAMGKTVWTLLQFAPDWRWLQERSDTPWYPSMRLYRQKCAGEWKSVFDEAVKALEVSVFK